MITHSKPVLLFLYLFLALVSCSQSPSDQVEIRGIYGNPKPLWDKGLSLDELGINAIFVHGGSINQDMIDRARSEGAKVFAEFATLNGKNYVEKHPEAWAIDEKGEKVEAASWFMGVCPTEPVFRQYRYGQLRDMLTKFDLDGIWMDYVHWHAQFEEPEPILPETCFCDHCLQRFSKASGIALAGNETTPERAARILENHDTEWRDWRCEVIHEWAVEMKTIINETKPGTLLGLYHCPWDDREFDGARRRILGLDYDLLRGTIDVFSPMVYHGRMGRNPEWVEENIKWFSDRMDIQPASFPKVWPIVQAYNNPRIITNEEFEMVMKGGLSGNSSGVMMFTTNAVAQDSGKTETMKNFYLNLMKK